MPIVRVEKITSLQYTLFYIYILIALCSFTVSSHARVQATAAISKTKGRAEKLIKVINSEYQKKNYQVLGDKLENQNVSADLTNPKESQSVINLKVFLMTSSFKIKCLVKL